MHLQELIDTSKDQVVLYSVCGQPSLDVCIFFSVFLFIFFPLFCVVAKRFITGQREVLKIIWFDIDEAVKLCMIFMISPNVYFAFSFFAY